MKCAQVAGVDVGLDFLSVAILPQGAAFKTPNTPAAIVKIVDRFRSAGVVKVVLESIGGYARALIRALADAGLAVGVVDPRRIKAFRTAEGRRAKTDPLDAELIARFALCMNDEVRPVPSAEAMKIRALSTRRRQLVEMIAIEKTRLKQALDEEIESSIKAAIAALSAERARIESELQTRVRSAPGGERRCKLLKSAPGVGDIVAATLMADLPELGRIDRAAIAALAGLAPYDDQSGARTGAAHIAGGRACVRVALYMAALSAVRCDAQFKAQYRAMRKAGKPAKVALIAIARKLLVAINSMLKEDRPWRSA